MKTPILQDISPLQAMLNFAGNTILNNPSLYKQAQENTAQVINQQTTLWKSFQ